MVHVTWLARAVCLFCVVLASAAAVDDNTAFTITLDELIDVQSPHAATGTGDPQALLSTEAAAGGPTLTIDVDDDTAHAEEQAPGAQAGKLREDGRCGPTFLAPDGSPAQCRDSCCSATTGWCGLSNDHCLCDECTDYRRKPSSSQSSAPADESSPKGSSDNDASTDNNSDNAHSGALGKVRDDGRCGVKYPAPDGSGAGQCNDGCCSQAGWCGRSRNHCCPSCSDFRSKASADADGYSVVIHSHNSLTAQSHHEQVLRMFAASQVFTELTMSNVGQFLAVRRPFVLFLLCNCERDALWDIPQLDNLIMDKGLEHRLHFLYVRRNLVRHFHCERTYGVRSPALAIDNIPIGQHVEKYVFPHSLESVDAVGTPAVTARDIARWLIGYERDPCLLPLVKRTQPVPESAFAGNPTLPDPVPPQWDRVENVWELVGTTSHSVLESVPTGWSLLLFLYSPTCPASQRSRPVMDRVAVRLKDATTFQRRIVVTALNKVENDLPYPVVFRAYPALLLFTDQQLSEYQRGTVKGSLPTPDSTTDSADNPEKPNEQPGTDERLPDITRHGRSQDPPQPYVYDHQARVNSKGGQCGISYDENDIVAWVQELVGVMGTPRIAQAGESASQNM